MTNTQLLAKILLASFLLHNCLSLPQYSTRVFRTPKPKFVVSSAEGDSIDVTGGMTTIGEYWANIYIGGQPQAVILDTGSSTLAVPDKACGAGCPAQLPQEPYNTAASNSFNPVMCGSTSCSSDYCAQTINPAFPANQCYSEINYGDGSGLRGVLAIDDIAFDPQGNLSAAAVFQRTLSSNNFAVVKGQASGILGMAYTNLNCAPQSYCRSNDCIVPCFPTPLDNLHSSASHLPYRFGMCLTQTGGTLDLGYADKNKMASPMQWVPVLREIDNNHYFYRIGMVGSQLGSTPLNFDYNNGVDRIIVDSGTTYIIAPVAWIYEFYNALVASGAPGAAGLANPAAYDGTPNPNFCCNRLVTITAANLALYPSLVFTLANGVTLSIPPSAYLLPAGSGYHLGMAPAAVDPDTGKSMFILGDVFMTPFYVVFDQDNDNVGFAPLAPGSCNADLAVDPLDIPIAPRDESAASVSAAVGAGVVAFSAFILTIQNVLALD